MSALGYKYSDAGEDLDLNNNCKAAFEISDEDLPNLHVIKVIFNAPASKDGVNSLLPTDTKFFKLYEGRKTSK